MIPPVKFEEFKSSLRQAVNENGIDTIFGAHDFVVADAIMFVISRPSFGKAVNGLELAYRADLSEEDRNVYDQVFGRNGAQDELPEDAEVQE